MQRLSGTDSVFLSGETPAWHQHVGGVTILDPADAPDFGFEKLTELIAERLPYSPKFSWKLQTVPYDLDRPVWVDDPDFDVRNHLIRAACPRPGDYRALCDMVGRIMSHQLDRRRPLWEMWFIEGLEDGKVAMAMKFHHAIADGMSGMALAEQLLDLEPNPAPRTDIPELQSAGDTPSDLELFAQAVWPPGKTPFRVAKYVVQQAVRAVEVVPVITDDAVASPADAPKVSWNGTIGPRRCASFGELPLEDVKKVKEHFNVKVNDVMIAVVGSALRSYLLEDEELPAKPLICGMPVSIRAEGDTEMTNKISSAFVSMGTHLDDPVDRLMAVHESTQGAKALQSALRAHEVQSIGETAPPMLINLASRTMWRNHIAERLPMAANTVVSNVPGPPFPLYVGGARVVGIYPMAPIMMGMGLNATLISYIDKIQVGFHADADLVPDPWRLIEGMAPALQELVDATVPKKKAAKKATKRTRKSAAS